MVAHRPPAAQAVVPVATPLAPTDAIQADLRHDFDALVMLMTASRDSLAFGTANQGVYAQVHRMLFSGVEKVAPLPRHPVAVRRRGHAAA